MIFIQNEDKIFPFESLSNEIEEWVSNHFSGKVNIEITYIFCSDEYLLEMNRKYLNHDYYTDIITFDNSETKTSIESDIFISTDRVEENAKIAQVELLEEYLRVMIHGIHHLKGQGDKTEEEETQMRTLENNSIRLFHAMHPNVPRGT
ncbi:MAG: rRNA maturation RNase YbeY [Cyclobacteriaceae bacterium]|nr:rRNA maturation RNase YbeY [Cyclobacteriaceae bacterium]MCH8515315.1 rRNA maturation RNase YbeY [Cyclobacteriaceae bacterium]